jgi:hypothetical protein
LLSFFAAAPPLTATPAMVAPSVLWCFVMFWVLSKVGRTISCLGIKEASQALQAYCNREESVLGVFEWKASNMEAMAACKLLLPLHRRSFGSFGMSASPVSHHTCIMPRLSLIASTAAVRVSWQSEQISSSLTRVINSCVFLHKVVAVLPSSRTYAAAHCFTALYSMSCLQRSYLMKLLVHIVCDCFFVFLE